MGDGGLAAAKFFGLGLFGKIVAASCLRSPEGVWLKQEAFAGVWRFLVSTSRF